LAQPLISCIVPVYNGARYLREALSSIAAQTYRSLEIVVVDDGSVDGTRELVASCGYDVQYYWQTNAGPASACNQGLHVSQGELIAFLEQDDLWHPEKLERQWARFRAEPELDFSVTHIRNFWTPELRQEEEHFRGHRRAGPVPGYVVQTLLARRLTFQKIGGFNPVLRFSHGMDWFLRADEQGAVSELLSDVLVYRRLHEANISRKEGRASRDEYLRLLKTTLDRKRRGPPLLPLATIRAIG
jgi:glycosyltransferase involved in cell wall biosynthesis